MAFQTLYAASVLDYLDLENPQNAIGPEDGVGTTNTGKQAWNARWAMDDPARPLVGWQYIRVIWRKAGWNDGNPTVSTKVLESNVEVKELDIKQVHQTTWTYIDLGYFNASEISDPNNVEIRIDASGANDNSLQVDAIIWSAEIEDGSNVNVWDGSAWKPMKVWDGSTWRENVSAWDGTGWVT